MQGTVQEFKRNDGGRVKVKLNGQWYNVGNDCDLSEATVQVGDQISFDSTSSDFKGKPVWWLNKYAKMPKPNGSDRALKASDLGPLPTKLRGSLDEPVLRFISNCVGSAITAGTIKDPADIKRWVSAARNAITAQTKGDNDEQF